MRKRFRVQRPDRFVVIAVHDDGKQIVAEEVIESGGFGRDKQHILVTMALNGNKIRLVNRWIPYSNRDEKGRHIRFAEFASGGKLVTCNEPGKVAVWDFASRKLDFFIQIPRTSIPALSPDRQHLGFAGGNKVGFVNLETRQPVAMKAADDMAFWVKAAFSPSGKRFAASSQQKLVIWDVTTGEVLFEGDVPGIALAYGLHFPAEDFVLLSNETLVEWTSRIEVWKYSGGGARRSVGKFMYIAANAVVPVNVPHPEAEHLLKKAKQQSDLFVVKKGTRLTIDVSAVPEQYHNKVKQSLTEQIAGIGCTVATDARVKVKATISGPKKQNRFVLSCRFLRIEKVHFDNPVRIPGEDNLVHQPVECTGRPHFTTRQVVSATNRRSRSQTQPTVFRFRELP